MKNSKNDWAISKQNWKTTRMRKRKWRIRYCYLFKTMSVFSKFCRSESSQWRPLKSKMSNSRCPLMGWGHNWGRWWIWTKIWVPNSRWRSNNDNLRSPTHLLRLYPCLRLNIRSFLKSSIKPKVSNPPRPIWWNTSMRSRILCWSRALSKICKAQLITKNHASVHRMKIQTHKIYLKTLKILLGYDYIL